MGKQSSHKKIKEITKVKPSAVPKGDSQYFYWVILVGVGLFTGFIRLRLLGIPLERDEGEFAYMGQLILQGIPPYLISYNMKLPGIYAAYAFIMSVFGQTSEGIHFGFLLINTATIILIFLLAKRLYDSYTGIIASTSFGILSVSPSVFGTSAHASHFVLLPALGGILLMLKAVDSDKPKHLFWSGVLLGLSFTMKQPGIFFVIGALLYFLFASIRLRHVSVRLALRQGLLFSMGALIPVVITCVILYRVGVFEKFWFWTFSYASQYVSERPLSIGMKTFFIGLKTAMGKFYLLWGIAGVGIIALFWDKTARRQARFVSGFCAFTFLAVCPGFYFRPHYFVFFLPAVALLVGIGISSLKRLILKSRPMFRFLPTMLFLAVCSLGIILYKSFFFDLAPAEACRFMYGSLFPESIEIAQYIEGHSKKDDKIAVLGSEPQIFFYANRHSATGYLYTYPLMENQKYALRMQKEMTGEIEKEQPAYLVFVNASVSWGVRKNSEKYILNWFKEYSERNYDLVGVADMEAGRRWSDQSDVQVVRSPHFVLVYKRRPGMMVH
jgi:4-amino-4-deoxy-L-arabinose transferase-like glycosyltransferase